MASGALGSFQRAFNRRETCFQVGFDVASVASAWRSLKTVRVPRFTDVGIAVRVAINPHEAPRDFHVRRCWECRCSGPILNCKRPSVGRWRAGHAGTPEGCAGTTRHLHRWTPARLSQERRALLQLHYNGKISADGFQEEEDRLLANIEVARRTSGSERPLKPSHGVS